MRNSINFQPVFHGAVAAPPPDAQLPFIRVEVERTLAAKMTATPEAQILAEPKLPANVEYLFTVRYSIEREVRRITEALLDQRSRTQIPRQVEILAETQWITRNMQRAITDVYRICSPAVHGDPVSQEQVDLVRDVAPRLLTALRQLPELRAD